MLRTALLCIAVVLASAPGFSQPAPESPPPTGTGLILGRVVYADAEKPVPGSIVVLTGGPIPAPGIRALTDRDGRFVFRRVPKGTYSVVAYKGGHMQGGYGRRRPEGPMQQLELDEAQRAGPITVPIWKGGAISGTLTDENGDPLVNVQVNIYRRGTSRGRRALVVPGTQTTDDRGAFHFWSLTPGAEYVVGLQTTTTVVPRSVADAYSAMPLSRNDPNARKLMAQMMMAGAMSAGPSAMSLRVGNFVQPPGRGPLPPSASPSGITFVYPTTFYPAAPNAAQARGILIRAGEERSGIDLQVRPVPAVHVSGTVVSPEGVAGHLALMLMNASGEDGMDLPVATTVADANGAFTFMGVPPGQYTVRAAVQPATPFDNSPSTTTMIQSGSVTMAMGVSSRADAARPLPAGPTYWTATPLSVGEKDIADVSIVLQAGARVSGRIEFDGTAERPDAARLQGMPLAFAPFERGANLIVDTSARIDADGQFTTMGLPGGKYFARPPVPGRGWTLKSMIYEGRDISDIPLMLGSADVKGVVLTYTDRTQDLTGVVTQSNGTPDTQASVIVFPFDPVERAEWPARRIRIARTSESGSYKHLGLPPGDYLVVALPDPEVGDWELPGVLEQLSGRATRVRIAEGETRSLNLRTARAGS